MASRRTVHGRCAGRATGRVQKGNVEVPETGGATTFHGSGIRNAARIAAAFSGSTPTPVSTAIATTAADEARTSIDLAEKP